MKNFIAILLMCVLSFPVFAVSEQEEIMQQNSQELEMITPDEQETLNSETIKAEEENIIPTKTPNVERFKVPSSKKQLAKKFIIAMLCVAGCSLFLYLTLSIYNRIRDGVFIEDASLPEGEEPLEAPNDITEAVKTFVDKTHWNGV